MWRLTPVLLVLFSGCADCFHDCLLQDSLVGDLVRLVPCKHANREVPPGGEIVTVSATDGHEVTVDVPSELPPQVPSPVLPSPK